MNVLLRELLPSDIDTCLSIMKENYTKENEKFWQDVLPNDLGAVLNKTYPSKCLVAMRDERMVGFGCYVKYPDGLYATATYKLTWINILPKEQGKGIGKKLVSALEECICKEAKGYFHILLETDKPVFYKKSGYETFSKNGTNDVMRKIIYIN